MNGNTDMEEYDDRDAVSGEDAIETPWELEEVISDLGEVEIEDFENMELEDFDEEVEAEDVNPPGVPDPGPPQMPPVIPPVPYVPQGLPPVPAAGGAPGQAPMNVPVRPKIPPLGSSRVPQETVIVARGWEDRVVPTDKRTFSRQRKIAEDLPEWSPMPPGEMTVTRVKKQAKGS